MRPLEREYDWYRIGCERTGKEVTPYDLFAKQWGEFEAYAERLRVAEEEASLLSVDNALRTQMQRRFSEDPFVRAVLVGMAEAQNAS